MKDKKQRISSTINVETLDKFDRWCQSEGNARSHVIELLMNQYNDYKTEKAVKHALR